MKTYKSVADMVRDLSENKEWGNAFADRLDSQGKQNIIRAFKMILDEKESLEKVLTELLATGECSSWPYQRKARYDAAVEQALKLLGRKS